MLYFSLHSPMETLSKIDKNCSYTAYCNCMLPLYQSLGEREHNYATSKCLNSYTLHMLEALKEDFVAYA